MGEAAVLSFLLLILRKCHVFGPTNRYHLSRLGSDQFLKGKNRGNDLISFVFLSHRYWGLMRYAIPVYGIAGKNRVSVRRNFGQIGESGNVTSRRQRERQLAQT